MQIAICDDEPVILNEVMFMIVDIIAKLGYEGKSWIFNSGVELLEKIEKQKFFYDIYILDINMHDINGIEVAKRIRDIDKNAIIVFLTSYQEWMPEAFDVQAFNYILKPIERKKIEVIFKKCFDYLDDRKILYYFKQGNKLFSIPYKDIYYFESEKRRIKIVTATSNYYYYDTISNVQKSTGEELFTRTHTSYLINMDYIRKFDGKCVQLENALEVPVSKKYVEPFNNNFMQYLKRRS